MPKIERTERQVAVRGSYQPDLPGNGGRAIGEGIASLGQAISGLGEKQAEQEMFDAKMKVSEYTHREAMAQDDKIANYNPKKDGEAGQFGATYEQERAQRDQEFVGQFKNPKVRQLAMLHTQQARQSAAARTQNARQGFVQQENIGRTIAHVDRLGEVLTPDAESMVEAHRQAGATIDQIPGLTPAQRNRLRGAASDRLTKLWYEKAKDDPEALERAKKDFEGGYDKWREQFKTDEKPRAEGGKIESHGEHSTVTSRSGARFRVASPHAERFAGLIADLEAEGVEIKGDQSGGYAKRNIAGTNTPSRHSHGEAIDINWDENGRGARGEMAKRLGPEKINEIAKRHGMTWGGNWRNPDDMHFEIDRSAQPARPVAKRGIVDVAGMRQPSVGAAGGASKIAGEEGDWGASTAPRTYRKIGLPDSADMGSHAINNFTDLMPKIDKRLAEIQAERAGREWVGGVLEGRTAFNPNDAEGRKFIDQTIGATDIGKRVFTGDPEALIVAGQISDRIKYVPKPIYDGLKGLTEQQDPKLQALGWTTINNLYARNPNIFNVHGDDKALIQQAEYVQRLSRLHGMDKALQIIAAEKDPDAKIHKKAVEKDVEKFMKGYEGTSAETRIAADMTESKLEWLFSNPDLAYDQVQKARAIDDYRMLLKRHYEATGSEEKAKAYAISDFKQSYGVTGVLSKRVMPYPPERFYPTVEGSHKYIEEDIKREVGTYSPSAKMETVRLISDGQTARDAALGKPTYKIRVERADGREEILPGRFHPDHKEPQAKVQEKFERARKGLAPQMTPEDVDAVRRGQRVPPPMRLGGPGSFNAGEPSPVEKAVFAGEKSANADQAALTEAKELIKMNEKPEDILRTTGWFQRPDGVWRNEIDDSQSRLKVHVDKPGTRMKLADVIDHPDLFAAYPQLKDVQLYFTNFADLKSQPSAEPMADFRSAEPWIRGREKTRHIRINLNSIQNKDKATARDIILHEVQHAIQDIEGDLTQEVMFKNWLAPYKERIYEKEGFEAQKRTGLTKSQRRNSLPYVGGN